jgi:hypothetical protein
VFGYSPLGTFGSLKVNAHKIFSQSFCKLTFSINLRQRHKPIIKTFSKGLVLTEAVKLTNMPGSTSSSSSPKDDGLRLVIMGPPGSGKGTQAPAIKEKYCICHLATGDMLRAAVKNQTPMGLKVKKVMESGGLVSDDIMVDLIKDNLSNNPVSWVSIFYKPNLIDHHP